MTAFHSFLLGLIQGAAEFLPISSSGHLAIAQNLLHMDAEIPEFFDILLHLGTLLAVFVAYWRDIIEIIVEFFRGIGDIAHHRTTTPVPPARRTILLMIIASLPLFGVLPLRKAVRGLTDNMLFVGLALIGTGFLLFFCDLIRQGRKNGSNASVSDAIIVGIGQLISTLPGISRSGMTISTGCFVGFDREFAVRFSFLLSIPAVLAANVLSLVEALEVGIDTSQIPVYLVGVVTAAVVGYLCICLLKLIAKRGHFGAFAYYCWAVGLFTLVMNMIR